jgi:hypothetical protein
MYSLCLRIVWYSSGAGEHAAYCDGVSSLREYQKVHTSSLQESLVAGGLGLVLSGHRCL